MLEIVLLMIWEIKRSQFSFYIFSDFLLKILTRWLKFKIFLLNLLDICCKLLKLTLEATLTNIKFFENVFWKIRRYVFEISKILLLIRNRVFLKFKSLVYGISFLWRYFDKNIVFRKHVFCIVIFERNLNFSDSVTVIYYRLKLYNYDLFQTFF